MSNTNSDLAELIQEEIRLGQELAEISNEMNPASPARYEAVRERWKRVDKQFLENGACLRARMTLRQRALVATAFAEVLRPLLERWACESTRGLYQRTMESLWSGRTNSSDCESFLVEIDASPELDCDDSMQRDSMVGSALSVVSSTLDVLMEYARGEDATKLADLDALVQDFMNGMEESAGGSGFSKVPTRLRELAFQIVAELNDVEAATEMRTNMAGLKDGIDSALDCLANAFGWSPDRLSNTAYGFSEVPSAQAEIIEIDWDA